VAAMTVSKEMRLIRDVTLASLHESLENVVEMRAEAIALVQEAEDLFRSATTDREVSIALRTVGDLCMDLAQETTAAEHAEH
jgi:hypothetical protein